MHRLVLAISYLFALPLAAQQPSHDCASVPEPAKRLACYDEAFPPSSETMAAAADKAQADFGLSQRRESLSNPGQTAEQSDPERIESQVIRVDHGGQRSFHLENGQVWTQTDARSTGHAKAGDVVQVRKAMMSGYQLIMPNGISVRVRRTR